MAAGLLLAESPEVRRFILVAALCTAEHALYVVTVGGDFMHYRLMFHVYPLLVAAAVAGLIAVGREHALIGLAASSALAIASLAPSVLDARYHMESLEEMHRCCAVPGIAYGRRLQEALPPDTVIATTMIGGIAYYSALVTIDQLGLTDREVARHGVLAKPIRRGHTKRATRAYLASRGVNLVLHHPRLFSCRQPRTKGPGAYVFIRIEADDCLRMLYLTPTPALSELFCSRPQDFVVRGISCPSAGSPGAAPARPRHPLALFAATAPDSRAAARHRATPRTAGLGSPR
jgi:hypothetical protein